MSSVTVRAPAKINLSLAVGPVRADGYHPLATVYQAVGLYDHLVAAPAPPGVVTLLVCGDDHAGSDVTGVPTDDRNLAVRAARLLAAAGGVTAGVHLRLRKAIPVAGGMAGGSSDAAATLVACDAIWGLRSDATQLRRLAARLGSDVPFCLLGGTAIGTGRGEQVSPVPDQGSYHWVVATHDAGLSTAAVYAELDRLRGQDAVPEPTVPGLLLDALRSGDAAALGAALGNDLQPAALALAPWLADVLARGRSGGALGSVVSGSGPSCVFLAHDEAHARDIESSLAGAGSCREVHRVTGPVGAAQVVRQ